MTGKVGKFWIYNSNSALNYGRTLCISYENENLSPLLKECADDDKQKWFIALEEKSSTYINVYDPSICLVMNNGKVSTRKCNLDYPKFLNNNEENNNINIKGYHIKTSEDPKKCLDISTEENTNLFRLNQN